MEHNGIYAIPKTDRGGAALFYSDENNEVRWFMDVFEGEEILELFVEVGDYKYTGDVVTSLVAVAGKSASKIHVATFDLDLIESSSSYTLSDTGDIMSVGEFSTGRDGFYSLDLTYSSSSDGFIIRSFYNTPSGFYVDTRNGIHPKTDGTIYEVPTQSGFVSMGSLDIYLDGGGTETRPGEEIQSVYTIKQKIVKVDEGITSMEIPVVVTDKSIYFVEKGVGSSDFLFSGQSHEAYSTRPNYYYRVFGEGDPTERVYDLSTTLSYTKPTSRGILCIGSPSEEVLINFYSVYPVPWIEDLDSSGLTDAFSNTIANVSVPTPVTQALSEEDLNNYNVEFVSQVGGDLYVRIGRKILELRVSSGATVSTPTDISLINEVTFDVGLSIADVPFIVGGTEESKIFLQLTDSGIVHRYSLDPETNQEYTDSDFTTRQPYTETKLDQRAIDEEHPILVGTKLDKISNEPINSISNTQSITGSFASEFGYVFLGSTSRTLVFMVGRTNGLSRVGSISTPEGASLVSGFDFKTYESKRSILIFKEDTNYHHLTIEYDPYPVIVQEVTWSSSSNLSYTKLESIVDYLVIGDGVEIKHIPVFSKGLAQKNSDDTATVILDISDSEWYSPGDLVSALHGYTNKDGSRRLAVCAGSTVSVYKIKDQHTLIYLYHIDTGFPVEGISDITGTTKQALVVWGVDGDDRSIKIYDTTSLLEHPLLVETRVSLSSVIKSSNLSLTVTDGDSISVYRKNRTLIDSEDMDGIGVFSNGVVSIDQYVVIPQENQIDVYKWWTGISPEVYYDETVSSFHVPLYTVDFEDDPPYYDRVVLERDTSYNEPITVAYEATSERRARQVVSNRRLSFVEKTMDSGDQILTMSQNTYKLLRNSTMWCLGLDPNLLIEDDLSVDDEFPYVPSDHITYDSYDLRSMTSFAVCGDTDRIDSILDKIPESGILIDSKYMPQDIESDVWFENREVQVYSRSVDGSEQLRVEFGEYSSPGSALTDSYQTPNYQNQDTGVIIKNKENDESFIYSSYRFWDSIWNRSKETGNFLSTLLDKRVEAQGEALPSDIVETINPAKFLLSHFLYDSALIIIRLKPDERHFTEDLIKEAKEQMSRVPWFHINKTLPVGSKCVTVYVVENVDNPDETLNPDFYNE